MMSCRELVNDFLMAYLAGELSAGDRWRFRLHLAGCRQCRAYLKSYRATVQLGQTAFADTEDAALPEPPEELVQAILAASGKQRPPT